MPNRSEQGGSKAESEYLHVVAPLLVLVSNSCGLSTAKNLIHAYQSEESGIQVFRTKTSRMAATSSL